MERSRGKRLVTLFFSMLYISAFTFGGGFVIVTLMKRRFVDELHWLDEQEMLDMTAIAQSSPGAIAVNAAVLVGWKVGGLAGMVTAVLGTVLPPVIVDVALGLRAKVLKNRKWVHNAILAAAFAATFFFRVNVVWIILCAALVGVILALAERKGGTAK